MATHIGDKTHLHLQHLKHAVIEAEAQHEAQHASGADISAPMLARPWAGQVAGAPRAIVIYPSRLPFRVLTARLISAEEIAEARVNRNALLARAHRLRAGPDAALAEAASPPVRIGVIGTGCIGIEHLQNLHLLRDVARVVAVADTHEPSRAAAARTLRALGDDAGVAFVESYDELLAIDEVDAVIVATPNDHHLEAMGAVCKAGKHCLVEKPLSIDVAGCAITEALADGARAAAAAAGRPPPVLWCGMEYRYIPTVARLRCDAHAGEVGTPRMLTIREHRFPFLTKVWRTAGRGGPGRGAGRGEPADAEPTAARTARARGRWATGTASAGGRATRSSRSAATSSTSCATSSAPSP